MPNTAIYELRPRTGDVFTILLATTPGREARKLSVAFIGLERSLAPEVRHFTERDLFRHSPNFRELLGLQNYKKWLMIDDYLSEIFGAEVPDGEEYRYKPTIALANLLFTAPGLDAVNYPSVATADYGINACMLPSVADANFVPHEAWMVEIGEQSRHPETSESLWRVNFIRRSHGKFGVSPAAEFNI